MSAVAAARGKFGRPSQNTRPPVSEMLYAFHFDATLYARYLRGVSESCGVERIEGKIVSVEQLPDDGFVRAVTLEDGRTRRCWHTDLVSRRADISPNGPALPAASGVTGPAATG